MIATERVYRTADGRYCLESDPEAAFLVCGVGGELPADYTTPTEHEKPVDLHEPKADGAPAPKRATKKG